MSALSFPLRVPLQQRDPVAPKPLPTPAPTLVIRFNECAGCGMFTRSLLCRACRKARVEPRRTHPGPPLPAYDKRIYLAVPKGFGRSARKAGCRFDHEYRLWFTTWGSHAAVLWPLTVPPNRQPSRATQRLLNAHWSAT